MSNKHKNPTISFRVSEYERLSIEARILASGMLKKDYFTVLVYTIVYVLSARKKLYILWLKS